MSIKRKKGYVPWRVVAGGSGGDKINLTLIRGNRTKLIERRGNFGKKLWRKTHTQYGFIRKKAFLWFPKKTKKK